MKTTAGMTACDDGTAVAASAGLDATADGGNQENLSAVVSVAGLAPA